jgi:hypothetical protein
VVVGGPGGLFVPLSYFLFILCAWLLIKDADLTGSFLQEKVDSNLILDFLQDNALWESSVLFPLLTFLVSQAVMGKLSFHFVSRNFDK